MMRAIVVALATVSGMLVGFVATFALVALTENCPPQVRTCDVGPMAGAALGFIVAPITGLFCGWLAIRYFRKRGTALGAHAI
jgi:hypothetical protein